MPDFRRKPNRLPGVSYRGRRLYFLTICTHNRERVFTDSRVVDVALSVLREKCRSYCFGVYAYGFMPDHLHLILVGEKDSAALPALVRAFKGAVATQARGKGISSLWQKGFYDHVIRSGEELDRVASYVFMNPVRAGLSKEAAEWPYSGSFMFDWKRLEAPSEPFVPPGKKKMAG
jgi:putative transposase